MSQNDSEWPKIIKYYLHSSKDYNWELGEGLGLKGDALRTFSYTCYEVKVELEVREDGSHKILRIIEK